MYFGIIEDPRCEVNVVHRLVDILKLVMIAVLCGMDELNQIIEYGENKKEFLKEEFDIRTIPSKATLTRVLAAVEPNKLSMSILCIIKMLINNKEKQIMIDGKAIKSTDAMKSMEKMIQDAFYYKNEVQVKKELFYPGESKRPNKITVNILIDGEESNYSFDLP